MDNQNDFTPRIEVLETGNQGRLPKKPLAILMVIIIFVITSAFAYWFLGKQPLVQQESSRLFEKFGLRTLSKDSSDLMNTTTPKEKTPGEPTCDKVHNSIEDGLSEADKVCHLKLNNQQLALLPAAIQSFNNLQVLDVSNNQLEQLPQEIFKLSKLKVLILENNELFQISPEISKLTDLVFLNLASNKLTYLPEQLASLRKLKVLVLANNDFSVTELDKIKKLLPKTQVIF